MNLMRNLPVRLLMSLCIAAGSALSPAVCAAERCPPDNMPPSLVFDAISNGQIARLVSCGLPIDGALLLQGQSTTPLQYAAATGRAELVAQVLDAGADPNHAGADAEGLVPLEFALSGAHFEAAQLLLARGARADHALPNTGLTPLMSLAFVHDFHAKAESLAQALLQRGGQPNAIDRSGDTALHHAARTGKTRYVRLLVKAGADRCAVNRKGQRPADVPRRNAEEIVRLLQDHCPAAAPASGAASR